MLDITHQYFGLGWVPGELEQLNHYAINVSLSHTQPSRPMSTWLSLVES